MEDVIQQNAGPVLEALLSLAAAVITWAATKVLNALKRRIDNETADRMLGRLENTVRLAVGEIEQSVVRDLREKNADGKLTQDEMMSLRMMAMARVRKVLGAHGMRELDAISDDIDDMIRMLIEQKVAELKATRLPAGIANNGGHDT